MKVFDGVESCMTIFLDTWPFCVKQDSECDTLLLTGWIYDWYILNAFYVVYVLLLNASVLHWHSVGDLLASAAK